MPKVSVIVPVYNTEKYLEKCLVRLINQTFRDIEIFCINDNSTDNSLNILKTFAEKDKRIKIINLPKRKGAAAARNYGLKKASGNYISFIDSDDIIDFNYYEELYKKALETNADIVKCKMCIVNTDNTTTISNLNDLVMQKSKMCFSNEFTTAIYKTSLISQNNIKFPEHLIISEDVAFLNKAVIKAKSVECIDNVFYYYCRRKGSLNSEKMSIKKIKSFLSAIEYILNDCDNALGKELSEDIYADFYFSQLNIIRQYLLKKNKTYKSYYMCVQKYIELFHKCKTPEKLEQLLSSSYSLYYLKEKNIEELIDIFLNFEINKKYETLEQYRFARMRQKVRASLERV